MSAVGGLIAMQDMKQTQHNKEIYIIILVHVSCTMIVMPIQYSFAPCHSIIIRNSLAVNVLLYIGVYIDGMDQGKDIYCSCSVPMHECVLWQCVYNTCTCVVSK